MKNGRYSTLDEFWPFYVSQHLNPTNRRLHFAGTTMGFLVLATGIINLKPSYALAALVLGYGPAWIGHFVFERNRPATFKWAWLSLCADLRLYRFMLDGMMDAEIERLGPELKALRAATD